MKKFTNFLQSRWGVCFLTIMCAVIAHLQGHDAFTMLGFAGVIAAVPGAPDYTQATGDGRIPELFSRIYRDKFYDAVCSANITI